MRRVTLAVIKPSITLFRRGSNRRFAAGFCAFALSFTLIAFPVRARATSVILPAAGLALTVTAFLNLAGIYPFDTESSFGDWSEGGLADLIQQYNDTNPAIQLNGETLHAYLYGGTAILTHNAYVALRNFVQWLKDTFSLMDNQEGVRIGVVQVDGYVSVFPSGSPSLSDFLQSNTYLLSDTYLNYYFLSPSTGVVSGLVLDGDNYKIMFASYSAFSFSGIVPWMATTTPSGTSYQSSSFAISTLRAYGDKNFYVNNSVSLFSVSALRETSIPIFSSMLDFYAYFVGYVPETTGGIVADTSTISVPPELPAEQDIGLAISPGTVSGADTPATAMTPQAVERIIQQGVTERERPVVTPVEVEIGAGTDVDFETGAVTENPVVIQLPEEVTVQLPQISSVASEWAIPGLNTVFPFSIPWDIANVFSALNATPVRPSFNASIYVPVLDVSVPFQIAVSQELEDEVDGFATVFRNMLLVALCVGTLWIFFRFVG